MSSSNAISDYELLRQQKILRNEEKLRSLGLLTSKEEPKARKSMTTTGTQNQHRESIKKRNTRSSVQEHNPPSKRMSLRLRGIDPFPTGKKKSNKSHLHQNLSKGTLVEAKNGNTTANWNEPTARTVNIQSTGNNKTTTKEHCQMRIRTMTIPQLQQRIRIIERARGAHCVAKLTIMYECCIDANLYELAEQANDAIQRLTKP